MHQSEMKENPDNPYATLICQKRSWIVKLEINQKEGYRMTATSSASLDMQS